MTKKKILKAFGLLSTIAVNSSTKKMLNKPDRDLLFRTLRVLSDLSTDKGVK